MRFTWHATPRDLQAPHVKQRSSLDMKHFLLQFKPYCIIAEKQPIPTNDRKGRHINESVHLKLMRFTKPPRENNIRHLSWFSYALDIMIKHLLQPTATQVTWRTCREKPSQKEKQGGRHWKYLSHIRVLLYSDHMLTVEMTNAITLASKE